ncbi:MAG TPA: NAD(+) diphosphatase [Povalibacter sp.]|uniref:NAD(+) diphosphatase n=1 Tax=Povalibacter sp. TaxID=1962978 RepID=UPI002C714BEB|nr:NAD(+) diphosphatase [Povalibacter sp.]HMN43575.1 NAD(+) diphosphatase [Povalibacter sp.]
MALPRSAPNHLAGPYLARLAQLRKDAARLRAALDSPATLFVPVWRTHSFIARAQQGLSAQFVSGLAHLGDIEPNELILLGEFRGQLCFAAELPSAAAPAVDARAEFVDLRGVAGDLMRDEAGLLAYARAMVLWRERHRFCGRCGAPTVAAEGGHVRRCSDERCGNQQFPRIDPAVIVLVTDGDRALLGRQAAWPPGRYSTIAGFVEPGESLEDAVAREVLEETGIEIASVDYHSSQPWPFPSSLMLGFSARAATTGIQRMDDELEDARWFTRGQIAAGDVALPTTHSISFRLIEDWYDAASAIPLREEPAARLWTSPARAGR